MYEILNKGSNKIRARKVNTVIIHYVFRAPLLAFLLLLFSRCVHEQNQLIDSHLRQWDAIMEYQPEAVLDSLQLIDPGKLSPANKAYYGLLKTIADDKTHAEFTSDSLISESEGYYNKQQKGSIYHIRSLIYTSIVNIRMGNIDTTAYIALKKAEEFFMKSETQYPVAGYLIYYYLGNLHYKHKNYMEANHYYMECLRFAELENRIKHIFDAYTALFWNEMTAGNKESGAKYLKKLSSLDSLSVNEEYSLMNMQSVYYEMIDDYSQSLQHEKEMITLLPLVKYKVDAFRTYFSISDKYKNINQLDSAMSYGLQSIVHITDSTHSLNYLLYHNIADIALLQGDYKTAEEYRSKTFNSYQQSVNERVDKRILELEKLYNHTEAKNKALKAETNAKMLALLSSLLILIISFILFVYSRRKRMAQLKHDKLQAEKLAIESKALLLQNQWEEQKNKIKIYGSFLTQYSQQQHLLNSFELKIRGSSRNKRELADDFECLLQQGKEQFNKLSNQFFAETMVQNLVKLPPEQKIFNEADRVLLVMLAMKLENAQISAFLNTTLDNLKSRKAHLKKKLKKNESRLDNYDQLISLF